MLRVPSYKYLSELFAFCTEYTTASIFWPNHRRNIDRYYLNYIRELIKEEQSANLNICDSVLEQNPHNFAGIIGRLILERYPKNWPTVILRGNYI
jgi:hypothetical protein